MPSFYYEHPTTSRRFARTLLRRTGSPLLLCGSAVRTAVGERLVSAASIPLLRPSCVTTAGGAGNLVTEAVTYGSSTRTPA